MSLAIYIEMIVESALIIMDKDIKLQLAIAKMQGEPCLAVDIDEIACQTYCNKCPYNNNPKPAKTSL